jgi:N-formylglutamate amidohydrolase
MSADRDFPDVPIFEILEPEQQVVPVIVNSPHSGRYYPSTFLAQSRLTRDSIRRSEDCFVDELFSGAVPLGAPMLRANFPRAYLDVNREPLELDPKMFEGPLPAHANSQSMRVGGGLGTIPRIVGDGMEIYRHRLPVSEALERIDSIYKPYHRALRDLITRTHARFGQAVLLDCHSMPTSIRVGDRGARPDFIIGDRFGTSASREISNVAICMLQSQGFVVSQNKPYAGGFITEHYGRPIHRLHALQIEVNRGLYVCENSFAKLKGYTVLKAEIDIFLSSFMSYVAGSLQRNSLAAE